MEGSYHHSLSSSSQGSTLDTGDRLKIQSRLKTRINGLIKSHYYQRIQLELALETLPRDSRYSDKLSDLMRREEIAIQESPRAPITRELTAKVDESLRQEIQIFYSKTTQQNIKKWQSLLSKLEKDRMSSKKEILMDVKSLNIPDYKPTAEAIDLDAEARRLEQDYNKNWLQYEMFHLNEAFESQASKIETEWSAHEINIMNEYNRSKAQIMGSTHVDIDRRDVTDCGRWQHPEKQKTLIHTAPVLSPKMDRDRDPNKAKHSSELDRIEKQYHDAMESLHIQKEGANRWMTRQKLRLISQAKEMETERRVLAEVLEKERDAYEELSRFIAAIDSSEL